MARTLITKCVLIAALLAMAIALSPEGALAAAKKKSAKMSKPQPCTAGATCGTKCNELKWCDVRWCSEGKWVETAFYCYDQFCGPRC